MVCSPTCIIRVDIPTRLVLFYTGMNKQVFKLLMRGMLGANFWCLVSTLLVWLVVRAFCVSGVGFIILMSLVICSPE